MGKIKKILIVITPPIIIQFFRSFFDNSKTIVNSQETYNPIELWGGRYSQWSEAEKLCKGYDSQNIIEKCFDAIQEVASGRAVYERDSVLFDKKEYSLGIVSSLFLAASRLDNHLSVLDFGGSFGTTYFQNKNFLSYFKSCNWTIVEQKKIYELGKKHFENNQLNFIETIEESLKLKSPNLIVISSSLQYISNPTQILDQINNSKSQFIVFDRIPFSKYENFITIQTVPPSIYDASYPCWIFNYDWLLSQLTNYKVVFDFPSYCDPDQVINKEILVNWNGLLFELL
jgi:putative methyltransferase (TIGR04325 family)